MKVPVSVGVKVGGGGKVALWVGEFVAVEVGVSVEVDVGVNQVPVGVGVAVKVKVAVSAAGAGEGEAGAEGLELLLQAPKRTATSISPMLVYRVRFMGNLRGLDYFR